jgi:hypothetical protein
MHPGFRPTQTVAATSLKSKTQNFIAKQLNARVEVKLVLNSLSQFIVMTFKNLFYLAYALNWSTGVDNYEIVTLLSDIFTLINPYLLFFTSDIVRDMLRDFFIYRRRYTMI